jgi:hypothetical protein
MQGYRLLGIRRNRDIQYEIFSLNKVNFANIQRNVQNRTFSTYFIAFQH